MATGTISRTLTRLGWAGVVATLLITPARASSEGALSIPTNDQGEPLFVTSCEGGKIQDIPAGAVVPGPSPLYPPELSARIAEAIELTTIELRSVEELAKLNLPVDAPWVETLREELAAGRGPIEFQDLRKDPWPLLQKEMAEVFDRYYDWCVRWGDDGDIDRDLLARSAPPWLT